MLDFEFVFRVYLLTSLGSYFDAPEPDVTPGDMLVIQVKDYVKLLCRFAGLPLIVFALSFLSRFQIPLLQTCNGGQHLIKRFSS